MRSAPAARVANDKVIAGALAEGLIKGSDVPGWLAALSGGSRERADMLQVLEDRRARAARPATSGTPIATLGTSVAASAGDGRASYWGGTEPVTVASSAPATSLGAVMPWWDAAARSVTDEVEDVLDEARREGRITLAAESGFRNRLYGADADERTKILASIAQAPSGQYEPARRIPTPGDFQPAGTAGVRAATAGARPGASQAVAASLRARSAGAFVQASASGVSMPKAFGAGDLPAITASGADPNLLGLLPWQARWAGARATREQLAAMVNEYQGEFGDGLAAVHAMNGGPFYEDVRVYTAECSNWTMGAHEPGYNGPIFS